MYTADLQVIGQGITSSHCDAMRCGYGLPGGSHFHDVWACDVSMAYHRFMVGSWCNICPIFAFSFPDLLPIPYTLNKDEVFKKVVHMLFMATSWSLWKHRNKVMFEGAMPSANWVIYEAKVAASMWLKTMGREPCFRDSYQLSFWPRLSSLLCCIF